MKKILALLLATLMLFTLAACGGVDTEEMLIGIWTCEREAEQDNVEQATIYTIELYQGGTCYKYNLGKEDGDKYNNHSGTWSVDDNILTITLANATIGFVIDNPKDPYSLTMQKDGSVILHKMIDTVG